MAGVLLILYVETHWILNCVLHQDADAARLFELDEHGGHVCMPAFCVAEAIARFRTLEGEARSFREQLKARRREAGRMDLPPAQRLADALETAIREQDLLIETLPDELGTFMDKLFGSGIERIPEDREIVVRANEYVRSLDVSRGDALVLATIIEHAARHDGEARVFLSGNTKDFGANSPAGELLRSAGIKGMSSTSNVLAMIAAGSSRGT